MKSTVRIEIKLIKVQDFNSDDLLRTKGAFYARGERISEWALAHGFSKAMVYSVLSGRSRARHGQAHLIAVALGLKAPPVTGTRKELQP